MNKKKVLIYSSPSDYSTNCVMDWVDFLGGDVVRLNGDDLFKEDLYYIQKLSLLDENISLHIDSKKINFSNIYSVWFRKDRNYKLKESVSTIKDKYLRSEVIGHLASEYRRAKDSVILAFREKKQLGSQILSSTSKMKQLFKAKKVGLDVPDTILTNKKREVELFLSIHDNIITKPIGQGAFFVKEDNGVQKEFCMYTESINKSYLEEMSDSFFPSLFQERLDKELEIRVFYLDGECYSMAIFSQLDEQTDVDFRMYNKKKKNRCVPYKLSHGLEDRIRDLMMSLDLKTGSLDFVKTKDGRTVFLEVNPWGQYGMTSKPCNYNLDEKIAKFLLNEI